MSNTDIVRKAYECFGKGDIDGLLALYSEDIKWTTPKIDNAVYSGSRKGKEALAEFFDKLGDSEDFSNFEPKEFIAEGDKVVVIGEFAATVKATGNTYSAEWVHVSTVKDGKIAEFQEYFDTAEANKAHQLHAVA
jgi:uncharacterized protein